MARLLARRYSTREPPPPLIRFGLRLRGKLNAEALQRALNEIARRHAGLRVVFSENPLISQQERDARLLQFEETGTFEPGSHVQLVTENSEVELGRLDLADLDRVQHDGAVLECLRREDGRSFEGQIAPRIRASLLKIGADDHLLIIFVDHLVCDRWSKELIQKELKTLYDCFLDGSSSRPALPKTSFPDFALWQDQARRSSYFDGALKY